MGKRGFTVIEVLMVIILTAVTAAIAVPMLFRGPTAISTRALAKKIQDDIRYAQSLAERRSNLDTPALIDSNLKFRYRMRFNAADANCAAANQYAIVNDADYDGTWGENPNGAGVIESARMPSTGADYFCVMLDTGDFKGLTATANFGGTVPADAGILEFDNYGIPFNTDGVRLTAGAVTVAGGGQTVTLAITPNTGSVVIQ